MPKRQRTAAFRNVDMTGAMNAGCKSRNAEKFRAGGAAMATPKACQPRRGGREEMRKPESGIPVPPARHSAGAASTLWGLDIFECAKGAFHFSLGQRPRIW